LAPLSDLQAKDRGIGQAQMLEEKMIAFGRLVLAALFASGSCVSAATLYVVERERGEVLAVDTDSGEGRVVASRLGEMIGVTVDRNGRLFVSQFRGFSPVSGTVALVNPVSGGFRAIDGTVEVFGLSADPEADVLYVGGYTTGDLYRLEEHSPGLWTVAVEASFGWPNRISHALKDGNLLYVACQDSGLWVKDLLRGTVTFGVEIPTFATILTKEAGGHLIVGSEWDYVYRIDTSTWEVVRTYEGFLRPCGVVVDPIDNTVLVADAGFGRVSRLDLGTGEVTTVTESPVEPWQIALAMDPSPPAFTEVTRVAGGLRLRWKGGPGVIMQQSSGLTGAGWEIVPGTENQTTIELPIIGASRFFRLIGP
jgi:hypothetical protein